jgi:uncharacterized protein YndB with AHSA1/START domain
MGNTTTTYSITVETLIHAESDAVWAILTDPVRLGELYWGCTVEGSFTVGGSIAWKGTWEGRPFEDGGRVLRLEPKALLQLAHWTVSSASTPETSPNLLTWRLAPAPGGLRVTFTHENISTKEMKEHSEPMWKQLLQRLKEMAEPLA